MKAAVWFVAAALCACHRPHGVPPRQTHAADAATAEPRRVRPASAAGEWYPEDPARMRAEIDRMLGAATRVAEHRVRMVLVPHAGWSFSGPVAAASFRQLDPGFERIVVVAANHDGHTRYDGVSVDRATHYAIPGGEIRVAPVVPELLRQPGFVDVPAAHAMHMIESELPFLVAANGRPFDLVPLVVDHLDARGIRAFATALRQIADARTLVVISVDLSHFYTQPEASRLDHACLDALLSERPDDVARCDTDGTQVLSAMNALAIESGWTPRLVLYRNSGEITGDPQRVVGYGAMAYEDHFDVDAGERAALLSLARRSVEARVRGQAIPDAAAEVLREHPRLGAIRGAFVTLREVGQLRGCIGTLQASRTLVDDVFANAASAATEDGRFEPVRLGELGALTYSISVLSPTAPLDASAPRGEALAPWLAARRPGVVLEYHGRRSTFLPEVWDELPEPSTFLGQLCHKQGAPLDCWRAPDARFETYTALHIE